MGQLPPSLTCYSNSDYDTRIFWVSPPPAPKQPPEYVFTVPTSTDRPKNIHTLDVFLRQQTV